MTLPYHPAIDPDRPLSEKAARGGIPALRSEAMRLSAALESCAVHVKHYQVKVDAVLAAVNAAPLPEEANELTCIELMLSPGVFDQAERIVIQLQEHDPNRSVEDCLNTIFCAGLMTLAD